MIKRCKIFRCLFCSVFGILIFSSLSFAGSPYPVTEWIVAIDSQNISGVLASTSTAIDISKYEAFSYKLEIWSGSAPDVSLEYQVIESTQDYAMYVGSSTVSEHNKSWVTPTTGGTIDASINTDQADGFSPMVTRWLRFEVQGVASNGADTYVSLFFGVYTNKEMR